MNRSHNAGCSPTAGSMSCCCHPYALSDLDLFPPIYFQNQKVIFALARRLHFQATLTTAIISVAFCRLLELLKNIWIFIQVYLRFFLYYKKTSPIITENKIIHKCKLQCILGKFRSFSYIYIFKTLKRIFSLNVEQEFIF